MRLAVDGRIVCSELKLIPIVFTQAQFFILSAAPRALDHGVDLAVYDGVLGAVHEKEGGKRDHVSYFKYEMRGLLKREIIRFPVE